MDLDSVFATLIDHAYAYFRQVMNVDAFLEQIDHAKDALTPFDLHTARIGVAIDADTKALRGARGDARDFRLAFFITPVGIQARPSGEEVYIYDEAVVGVRVVTPMALYLNNIINRTQLKNALQLMRWLHMNVPVELDHAIVSELSQSLFSAVHVFMQGYSDDANVIKQVEDVRRILRDVLPLSLDEWSVPATLRNGFYVTDLQGAYTLTYVPTDQYYTCTVRGPEGDVELSPEQHQVLETYAYPLYCLNEWVSVQELKDRLAWLKQTRTHINATL